MHQVRCSEVWGGVHNIDLDVSTVGLAASLFSSSCTGGRGGDIYYFSLCNENLLTRIAVADVVGHGEPVSHVSQWLYDAMLAQMNNPNGHVVLAELNRLAAGRGYDAMTTAVVVAFYKRDSNLYFSYAGHPPVLVRRGCDRRWQILSLTMPAEQANLPLGVAAGVTYDQDMLHLDPGDRLFIYTDGLVEAPGAGKKLFGVQRLMETLEERAHSPLSEVKNSVLAALRAHTGGSLGHDDVTLMAVEVR